MNFTNFGMNFSDFCAILFYMYKTFLILTLLVFFFPVTLHSAMTGGSFEIYADNVGFVNTDSATGGGFTLYGSGEAYQGSSSTAGAYILRGGFQSEEKGILSLTTSASSLSLGTLSTGSVASATVTTTISTDSETGYTLAISEDGNLRDGANTIDDVSDGTITAGSEEYGISTNGADGLLSSDTAISGSVSVASASGTVTSRQTGVIFEAGISAGTTDGSYSHIVTFTATVNP
jgi:hypothetical protein